MKQFYAERYHTSRLRAKLLGAEMPGYGGKHARHQLLLVRRRVRPVARTQDRHHSMYGSNVAGGLGLVSRISIV